MSIGRVLEVPLNFLERGGGFTLPRFIVTVIQPIGKVNPLSYVIEEELVECGDTMRLRLAPGGGQAVRFREASRKDISTGDTAEQALRRGTWTYD